MITFSLQLLPSSFSSFSKPCCSSRQVTMWLDSQTKNKKLNNSNHCFNLETTGAARTPNNGNCLTFYAGFGYQANRIFCHFTRPVYTTSAKLVGVKRKGESGGCKEFTLRRGKTLVFQKRCFTCAFVFFQLMLVERFRVLTIVSLGNIDDSGNRNVRNLHIASLCPSIFHF